jgi:hypothetical protein
MPHEFSNASYNLVKQPKKREFTRPTGDRTEPDLLPSDKKTLDPKYLLQHENRFDPNVYTPEQIMNKSGSFSGMRSKEEVEKI